MFLHVIANERKSRENFVIQFELILTMTHVLDELSQEAVDISQFQLFHGRLHLNLHRWGFRLFARWLVRHNDGFGRCLGYIVVFHDDNLFFLFNDFV